MDLNPLIKREQFAVSLRKAKKKEILASKRLKIKLFQGKFKFDPSEVEESVEDIEDLIEDLKQAIEP